MTDPNTSQDPNTEQEETNNSSDEEIKREQVKLNGLYDKFSKEYGLINSRTNERAFCEDSSYYLLCSLEVLNENKQFVRKRHPKVRWV